MTDMDSHHQSRNKRIVSVTVPVALVGLLSFLPTMHSTEGAIAKPYVTSIGTPIIKTAADDDAAPIVYFGTATISPSKATPEDPARLSVRVTDPGGVASVLATFEHVATGYEQTAVMELDTGTAADGTWVAEFDPSDGAPSGAWVVASIVACDGFGNYNYVLNSREEPFGDGVDLTHLDFTFAAKEGADTEAPSIDLKGCSVSKGAGTPADPPTFSVRVTDDTGVTACAVWCTSLEGDDDVLVELRAPESEGGLWTGPMPVTGATTPGEWMVSSIIAYDAAGNVAVRYDGRDEPLDDEADDLSFLDFEVAEAASDDHTAPIVYF